MRRKVVALAAAGLIAALVVPATSATASKGDDGAEALLAAGGQVAPKTTKGKPRGVNPYLALVADPASVDFAGWARYVDQMSANRAAAASQAASAAPVAAPIAYAEAEPADAFGQNDTAATAETVPGFGTRKKENNRAVVDGTLHSEAVATEALAPNVEDDGSIPLASDTGIGTVRDGITTSGTIGDGPHGSAGSGSGDFDVYAVTGVPGDTITASTATPTGPLDTMVAIFDAAGEVVAFNDDAVGLDSVTSLAVTDAAQYYVLVTGFAAFPDDPNDSASGSGAESEGPYGLTITSGAVDVDVYAVRLRKGDVLGTSVAGAASVVSLYDPSGELVMGSNQDASFIYSANTPLPGGGNAVADHVADETGTHYVAISDGDGPYSVTVEAYRPALERTRPAQTLFLDFDGARLNTGIFGGAGVRDLSPLSSFLGGWGLSDADLDPLIDQIVATVEENVQADLAASGLNDKFQVVITNSRDDRDTFGKVNVSRVIVGGTIDESGILTIGIAQSIDPGNFGTSESALVLLDVLSEPATEVGDASLNNYITSESDVIGFIGRAIGNVTSHEAGHFFGNFHVDQFNDVANLMDQGGNFPFLYGVGPDDVGGTADDVDVDFGEDTFNPNEGFAGTEDTQSRVAMVLSR